MTTPPNEPNQPLIPNYAGPYTAPPTSKMAMATLILGVLAFPLSILTGIPAVILGIITLVRIDRAPERYGGKGFVLTGVIMAGIFSFAVPLLFSLSPSRGGHGPHLRVNCASNIRLILIACVVYANDNNNQFPLTVATLPPTGTDAYSVGSGPEAPTYFATDSTILWSPKPGGIFATPNNNPTAPLWLLVLNHSIGPKQLICRQDPFAFKSGSPLTNAAGRFYQYPQQAAYNSYSIAFPWNTKGPGAASYWKNGMGYDLPLISDMALRQAPGDGIAATGKKINSPNHKGDGQNVGYGDGHVEWPCTPLVGQTKNDSIFHWGGYDSATKEFGPDQKQSSSGITLSEPPSGFDIFMVPQRDASGKLW